MNGFAGISGSGTAGADESSGVGFGSGSPTWMTAGACKCLRRLL